MRLFAVLVLAITSASGRPGLPLTFEPNRGQAGPDADFTARIPGYALALHSGNAIFRAPGSRISATLIGGRTVQPEPEEKLPSTSTYLVGRRSEWLHDVANFNRVRYRGIYPGIDIIYYSRAGSLEYDFVIAPGADPRRIRIRFEGARRLSLDPNGDLVIDTPSGPMRQRRPTIYQETAGRRVAVPGRYILQGSNVRFHVAAFDRSRPLVIDPALTWAVFTGTTISDDPRAIAIDPSGNTYIAGSRYSYKPTGRYGFYSLIAKFDSGGNLVKAVTIGGPDGDDDAYCIAVDSTGAIYVAGETTSYYFALSTKYAGYGADAYFAKIDPAMSTLVYGNYFGGSSEEIIYGCVLDANNNLYLGGTTASSDLPVTANAAQGASGGGIDGFLAKVDSNGNPVYSSYLGGAGADWVYAIALDASGNWFATGQTDSTNLPVTSGSFQPANGGGQDAFIGKFSSGGSPIWLSYLGGGGNDAATAIGVDASGAPVVTGGTASADFPTAAAYQSSNAGGALDMFVARFKPDGSGLAWSTYLGGSGDDLANALALDAAGNVYVGGQSSSTNFPSLSGWQTSNRGEADGTVTALSADGGSLLFSSYFGGSANDLVEAMAVNCTAGLVLTGSSGSNNFPASGTVPNIPYSNGATSGFVAKVAVGTASTVISPGGIVNAATSSSSAVSPGTLVSIYGTNLASAIGSATSAPLPVSLNGATVTVNGSTVPLLYVSPGQINFQLPYEVATGTASATVSSGCGPSAAVPFQVVAAAPYLYLGSNGDAVVQNQDYTVNSADNPAPKGSYVTVYLTGIGPLDQQIATGTAAPTDRLFWGRLPYKAQIGGMETTVQFLGLTPGFVGLAQANLLIPNLSPGKYAVVVTVNGVDSNGANLYVK